MKNVLSDDFAKNITDSFLSEPEEPKTESKPKEDADGQYQLNLESVPEGYKLVRTETRTKRVQLQFTPTLYDKLLACSLKEGYRSFNEFMNHIAEKYLHEK